MIQPRHHSNYAPTPARTRDTSREDMQTYSHRIVVSMALCDGWFVIDQDALAAALTSQRGPDACGT